MSDSPATVEWKRVSRRFKTPLRTGSGEHVARESLVVRVRLEDGRTGYAECAPWPGFPVPSLDAREQELRSVTYELADGAGLASRKGLRATSSLHTPPCLIRAALDWARLGWGEVAARFPCAGLLRDDAEAPARAAAGFTTLKRKIGVLPLRDEQRAVAALVRACGAGVSLRLDANGALGERDCALWCDFLSEFPEIAWLEQPLPVGKEVGMLAIAERAGVADRLALDESACAAGSLPETWSGVLAVKPVLLGDLDVWRARRDAYAQVAYASAFETPFGRQAALCVAAEDSRAGFAVGFDTLGAFGDDLDIHPAGPFAATVVREPAFWDALWNRL